MIKKLSASVLFCLISLNLCAQNWGGGVDYDRLHFGFTFQYISSELKVYKKANWRDPFYDNSGQMIKDSPYSISSPKSPGFALGFVSDLKLTENLNLRLTPLLVFTDRMLDYRYGNEEDNQLKKTSATMVDIPLGFKIKSDRINNYRAYFIAGGKYSIDIISKKKTNNELINDPLEKLVLNKRNFFSYEAGIGLDLYFEFFKLSPEIKLSNSFGSILHRDKEENAFSQPLDKVFLRNFQFSLYFE
ncbi:outer membrane beta-barrel protein [Pedobacter sp. SYSU D00535]|uniref:type IX secretion/gliding motility protein PorT/SprT n=1 Tax=Pedobacter sp. SYSU D00535 TaxID=2810308 RepID=UPI001A957B84|nr:outer membrane beta-barrel protein [Pedobacter sp. SYSU D00535]